MSKRRIAAGLLALTTLGFGQLTPDQRVEDFKRLAGLLAYNYAPYEWKRDRFGVDLYAVQPWLDRIRKAPSDLEAIEVMSEYVASLRDTHAQFQMQANFSASLPLSADIVDGNKVVVDGLNRAALPVDRFPIQLGDEVVSVDGRSAADQVTHHARFLGFAEERALRRFSAQYIFFRHQALFPRAFELGDNAVVSIRHLASDTLGTYEIPWTKRGVAIRRPGPVVSPSIDGVADNDPDSAAPPLRASFLEAYHNRTFDTRYSRLLGLGARAPYYTLPAGFTLRLGRLASDFFFSGTYNAGGKRIGLLRIRNFTPPSTFAAVQELAGEVQFLQQNTDGLVVDVSRNNGGNCSGAEFLRYLIPRPFELPADEVRASLTNLYSAQNALLSLRAFNADAWRIALMQQIVDGLDSAYRENRGRTGPLPICAETSTYQPATGNAGQVVAYSKPMILLTDEFSISFADTFAATFQDNRRGPVFGYRSNGAGGAVSSDTAGFYSEVFTSYSMTLGKRNRTVVTPDYGTTDVLENVGVRPDIEFDYMTLDNLRQGGRLFTDAFTAAIIAEIDKGQQ